MKIWLACFFILFALAELFDWVKDFSLPLPIYILGGAFLAVASNYNRLIGSNIVGEILPQRQQLDAPTQGNQGIDFDHSSENVLSKSEITQ
ncbi:hypothetical protein [Calothrix sp. PCC 6303]|uniref:hypothetical protein n=1 Tax=Calothrix sp. PCC 6303 TaxID=1170562 RepID=UPI0002A03B38|nr:hypothetical protein [Calothrix sp. PCC 6303]AFZ03297.1 hypothetical protein Cal6303_4391 [Calothrix sp. PCC 6303]